MGKKNSKIIELHPWMHWISESMSERKKFSEILSTHDRLCELAVSSYELYERNRKAELKDRVQFFLRWWFDNRDYMNVYKTFDKIASLLKIDHATVIHHVRRRKPTMNYGDNTKCIKDFLVDQYD